MKVEPKEITDYIELTTGYGTSRYKCAMCKKKVDTNEFCFKFSSKKNDNNFVLLHLECSSNINDNLIRLSKYDAPYYKSSFANIRETGPKEITDVRFNCVVCCNHLEEDQKYISVNSESKGKFFIHSDCASDLWSLINPKLYSKYISSEKLSQG